MAVSAGSIHSLALTKSGVVWYWGASDFTSSGVVTADVRLPIKVKVLDNERVLSISAGTSYSLAVTASGVLGWNNLTQPPKQILNFEKINEEGKD